MLKKILLALIAVSLLITLNSPLVMAAGTDDNSPQDEKYCFSYWNIDNIYAVTQDGRSLIFEFPSDFFYKTTVTEETVALRSTDGSHEIHLRFGINTINNVDYMVVTLAYDQENATFVHVEYNMVNNVLSLSNSLGASFSPAEISAPYFAIYNAVGTNITSTAITSYNARYSVVLPRPRDDGSVGFDKTDGRYDRLNSTLLGYDTVFSFGVPQSQVDSIINTFLQRGYATRNVIPYYDYVTVSYDLGYYDALNSTTDIYLPVGFCDSTDYIAGPVRVSLWYDRYGNFEPFPTYPDSEIDYGLEDITDFFATVVSGIFEMEIFPGIFIGGIVFAIFGIAFVKAAINFFAGG